MFPAVFVCQPRGARKWNDEVATVCHCSFTVLEPPQPARMSAARSSACFGRIDPGIRRAVATRKDRASMVKTKDKVYDTADNVKPYVQRAMSDEKLRDDVMSAFATAKELYNELIGSRGAVTLATRVATDEEVRDKLKEAVEDLRNAAQRLQGKQSHSGRNTTLLVAGIALGLLFNPITGPETRKWLKDMLGGGDEFGGDYSPNGGGSSS
jgi:gas vesicle protein